MLPILHRTSRVMTLGAVENDVNLASKMSNPKESLNAVFFNTAAKGASNISTPATRTGTTWLPGSSVFWRNSVTNTGATGSNGSPGGTGPTGGPGTGGTGGTGTNTFDSSAPAPPSANGAAGGPGAQGVQGGDGTPGSPGGPCFTADTVSGLRILVDNGPGTLTGGTGGTGGGAGLGGPGGPGGGGGGGGGRGAF
jgi:hypothetical protein